MSKKPAWKHQAKFVEEHVNTEAYALFWEQGTGKSRPLIENFCELFAANKIDAVIIVAPPGVERNWLTDELPQYLSDEAKGALKQHLWRTAKAGTKWHQNAADELVKHKGLAVLSLSYNAFMTDKGKKFIWRFLQRRRVFYILDESHHIKTPGIKRTKSVVASGVYAPYRRLADGTYCPEGPFDVYAPVKFLDPTFWKRRGIGTAAEFRQFFGRWYFAADCLRDRGFDPGYDKLLGYKNLDVLNEWLGELSSRVLKDDVLDLPPKVYNPPRYFEMTPEWDRHYRNLEKEFSTELDGKVIDADLAIVRLIRFQQIVCGYIRAESDEPEVLLPGPNPRLQIMEDIRDSFIHPTIVWARFQRDIEQITDLLGPEARAYYGKLDDDECERSKLAFQKGDAKWFVATQKKGKEGLTLTQAHHVVYYSNTYPLLDRLQSEDRAHRGGLEHSVDYTDLICLASCDESIVRALRSKMDVAAQITGDRLRNWI